MLGQNIDTGNPVSDHPLNYGLAHWWLPLPGQQGGSRVFDVRGGAHATLTNGPLWRSGPGLPNAGHMAPLFDGSNDYAAVPAGPGALAAGQNLTVAFVLRQTNSGVKGIVSRRNAATGTEAGWGIGRSNSGGQLYFGTGSSGRDDQGVVVGSALDGGWHHVAVTFERGVAMRWHTDGALTHTTASIDSASAIAGPDLRLMGYGDGTVVPSAGQITGVRLYYRLLDAGEVWRLYEDWRRGYADTLRRFSRRAYLLGTEAGGGGGNAVFNAAWCRNTNVFQGFGR